MSDQPAPSAPRIRLLPSELADQIAAGEVVERPASVVKELVENAIDAGARRIEVAVDGGGLQRITVSDDGEGMTPEEAHLAIRRHATSKLSRIEDLFALSTMGFRGEALPSIAAVSQLTLTTRARHASELEGAYRLEVTAGIAGEGRRVGAPVGTEVDVRDLLKNVPARLKFMKAEATESSHVVETMMRLALAHPTIHFKLRSQGRPVLDLPPHASGLERARVALGRGSRTPVALHLAVGEEAAVHVEAYLGSPAESAGTSRNSYLFVNRRFVRDRGLLQALVMGYGEILDRGRYPLAVVHVAVRGESVDVNVHPQKMEVRFSRPQEVYAAVRHTVARAVASAPWLREAAGAQVASYSSAPARGWPAGERDARYGGPERDERYGERDARYGGPEHDSSPGSDAAGGQRDFGAPFLRGRGAPRELTAQALRLFAPAPALPGFGASATSNDANAKTDDAAAQNDRSDQFFSSLTYLGQLDRTYLVCEAPGELVLVDQHAAHERVAFQKLRDAHARRQVRTQRLLLPVSLELDERTLELARTHASLLGELGFELEPAGERELAVRAAPELLLQASPAEVLKEVLEELDANEALPPTAVDERLDHIFATMACHSVVRAGDLLSEAEVRALFAAMDGIDYRAHCPHGRPVLLRLSIGELERRFGRT